MAQFEFDSHLMLEVETVELQPLKEACNRHRDSLPKQYQ